MKYAVIQLVARGELIACENCVVNENVEKMLQTFRRHEKIDE